MLAGFDTTDSPIACLLLDRYRLISIDAKVADLAAQMRREHRWKLPDALQAASARLHGLKLSTRNTKDFPPERFSFVEIPYVL